MGLTAKAAALSLALLLLAAPPVQAAPRSAHLKQTARPSPARPSPARLSQAQPSPAQLRPGAEDERLMALLADDARREDVLDPLERLSRGEKVDAASLGLVFTDTLSRRRLASVRQSLTALAQIQRPRLSPERQISFDAFLFDKREELAWLQPDLRELVEVQPINHFDGVHTQLPALLARGGALPYETEADYRAALALQAAIPQVFAQATLRLREGMATGVVEPRLTVVNMISQIDAILAQKPEESPFRSPVLSFPPAMPEPVRQALRRDYAATAEQQVYPAYRALRRFLAEEYLPAARLSVGLADQRGGAALYRRLIKANTTLALDPAEVHRLGLSEVSRIQREMEDVARQLGSTLPLRQFFDRMRDDPRYHPRSQAQLAAAYAATAGTVDVLVPQYFSRLPKARLVIAPYPSYRERYEAGGSYNQGSPDGTRAGTFFYNTYDLPSRFLTGVTTLYLHEGIPGHHFQVSLAQEDTRLPDFQRFGGNTAYVEGWALYAETLGYPMGLYADPMQHWGTLDDEMLRAMRLVVDTGIHMDGPLGGWTREKAIDYMLANSGMGRTDATAEVERYIAIPGQALAYKIGALTIQRLRARAEEALGPSFDIRAFHDEVLNSGALPLPVLEAKIDHWIAAQK